MIHHRPTDQLFKEAKVEAAAKIITIFMDKLLEVQEPVELYSVDYIMYSFSIHRKTILKYCSVKRIGKYDFVDEHDLINFFNNTKKGQEVKNKRFSTENEDDYSFIKGYYYRSKWDIRRYMKRIPNLGLGKKVKLKILLEEYIKQHGEELVELYYYRQRRKGEDFYKAIKQ